MNRDLTFRAVLRPDGLHADTTIRVDGAGRIAALTPGAPPYEGFLALPGMPNAHSHVFQRALAGFGEATGKDDSFWGWRRAMYGLANAVNAEQLSAIAKYAFAAMLREGFTRVAEFHYLHHGREGERGPEMSHAITDAAREVGIDLALLPAYYRTAGFDGSSAAAEQRRFAHDSVDDFLASVERLGSRAAGLAPHSLRAVPPGELAALVQGADDLLGDAAPLHIHVSEQEREVAECRERFGRSPIELLDEHVGLGPRWSLVHATHATAGERARIRESGAVVVLCPLTEAYLGDGLFEAHEHFVQGGVAAVGSDSNARISAVGELRALEYGQRLKDRRRARLSTDAGLGAPLWTWCAAGGGRATATAAGRIEVGAPADLLVLDAEGPAIAGHEPASALDAWLVGGDGRDIAAVYVGGRRCVDRGLVDGESEIRTRFTEAMRALGPAL